MIATAERCRQYAAESKLLGSIDIPTERSIHQSMMSLRWSALADQIDRDIRKVRADVFAMKTP